jgi:hypothetical protein
MTNYNQPGRSNPASTAPTSDGTPKLSSIIAFIAFQCFGLKIVVANKKFTHCEIFTTLSDDPERIPVSYRGLSAGQAVFQGLWGHSSRFLRIILM